MTAQYIEEVIQLVYKASGYPYPSDYVGTAETSARAFAYGVALGTLSKCKDEWEQREAEAKRD